jgi:hypothetical protein
MATMIAPKGITEVNFDGYAYDVVGGVVIVPQVAIPELTSHGFIYDPLAPLTAADSAVEDRQAANDAMRALNADILSGRQISLHNVFLLVKSLERFQRAKPVMYDAIVRLATSGLLKGM